MTGFATRYVIRIAAISLVCLCTIAGLGCDTQPDSGLPQSAGTRSQDDRNKVPGTVADVDGQFIKTVASVNNLEVQLGRMAMDRSSSNDVKSFANKMVEDHSKANDDLRQLASMLKVSLPTTDDVTANAMKNKLSTLPQSQFDRAYIDEMVKGHSDAVNAFETYIKDGQDTDVKGWASKTLPVIREHLTMAKDIQAKLGH
jgi:putative membrane protein